MPDTCFVVGFIVGALVATGLLVRWGWRAMDPLE